MDGQQRWYADNLELDGCSVLDVGANVGAMSAFFFKQVGPKGRVISVEPLPDNIRHIEARMRKARAGRRWLLRKCAAAPQDGTVQMDVVQLGAAKNGVVRGEGVTSRSATTPLEVRAQSLTTLAAGAQVIKLDIEGFEHAVLRASAATLPHVRAWALELHDTGAHPLETTLGVLADQGFSLVAAGRDAASPDAAWLSVPIEPSLTWDAVPGTPSTKEGKASVFRMLHVLARRG